MNQTIGITLSVTGNTKEQMTARINTLISAIDSMPDVKFEEYERA